MIAVNKEDGSDSSEYILNLTSMPLPSALDMGFTSDKDLVSSPDQVASSSLPADVPSVSEEALVSKEATGDHEDQQVNLCYFLLYHHT